MTRLLPLLCLSLGVGCGSPTAPAVEPSSRVAASDATPPSGKHQLAAAMLGPQDLGDWSVRLGYDLGILRMLVLARSADAQSVTLAQLALDAPGAAPETMAAVFAGTDIAEPHPFGLLGYDHVVARAADEVVVRGRRLPLLTFSWLRIDPDSARRESGRGAALLLHCGDAGPIDGRWLLLASETIGTEHDTASAIALAEQLEVCR